MLWALGLNVIWLAVGAFSFQRLLGASKRAGSLLQIGE
jgi:hypothetical protein